MDWRLAFPADYIGAAHLQGRDVSLTISGAGTEDLRVVETKENKRAKQKTEKKLVLRFAELENRRKEGSPTKMVLNKTNAKTIAKLHGNDIEGWAGKRITLYPTTCLAFGQTVDCVRIRERIPPSKRGRAQPEPMPEPIPEPDAMDPPPPDDLFGADDVPPMDAGAMHE